MQGPSQHEEAADLFVQGNNIHFPAAATRCQQIVPHFASQLHGTNLEALAFALATTISCCSGKKEEFVNLLVAKQNPPVITIMTQFGSSVTDKESVAHY